MTDESTEQPILRLDMRQRAEALRESRNVLSEKRGAFGGSNVNRYDVSDLVDVAEYIVRGAHPLDRHSGPEMFKHGDSVPRGVPIDLGESAPAADDEDPDFG